ncbi:MAG: NAD(P)(+) transhydrogenase (Re/Si-specific) subunit beta [Rhodanobacteraceae bacterium]|nr:NAD(P)(+) transhydrogenase (Re/Si-specific) subunit beta [Rhodanobacteraceae bacterium]
MIAAIDWLLPLLATAVAASAVWIHRRRAGVKQLVASHVAFAGGTALVIGAVGLFRAAAAAKAATGLVEMEQAAGEFGFARALLALAGVLTGTTALAVSLVVLARLKWNSRAFRFGGQWRLNLLLLLAAGVLGAMAAVQLDERLIIGFGLVCLALGVGVALPVAPADFSRALWSGAAMAGLAWVCTGLALRSPVFAIAGMVVGVFGVLRIQAAIVAEGSIRDALAGHSEPSVRP